MIVRITKVLTAEDGRTYEIAPLTREEFESLTEPGSTYGAWLAQNGFVPLSDFRESFLKAATLKLTVTTKSLQFFSDGEWRPILTIIPPELRDAIVNDMRRGLENVPMTATVVHKAEGTS